MEGRHVARVNLQKETSQQLAEQWKFHGNQNAWPCTKKTRLRHPPKFERTANLSPEIDTKCPRPDWKSVAYVRPHHMLFFLGNRAENSTQDSCMKELKMLKIPSFPSVCMEELKLPWIWGHGRTQHPEISRDSKPKSREVILGKLFDCLSNHWFPNHSRTVSEYCSACVSRVGLSTK